MRRRERPVSGRLEDVQKVLTGTGAPTSGIGEINALPPQAVSAEMHRALTQPRDNIRREWTESRT
jgi:hypothetical protein